VLAGLDSAWSCPLERATISKRDDIAPELQALWRAALGGVLGLLGGIVTSGLMDLWPVRHLWALGLGVLSGIVSGATLGALGMVLLAYAIDRLSLGLGLRGQSDELAAQRLVEYAIDRGINDMLGAIGWTLPVDVRQRLDEVSAAMRISLD
jgi:hypothetical protein